MQHWGGGGGGGLQSPPFRLQPFPVSYAYVRIHVIRIHISLLKDCAIAVIMFKYCEATMAEIEELLNVSTSSFLEVLFARLTRNWQGVCRNFVF
jgi:hypothetical protein